MGLVYPHCHTHWATWARPLPCQVSVTSAIRWVSRGSGTDGQGSLIGYLPLCFLPGPELNALQEELAPFGLVILGFPCNQFGKQEPGENSEILPSLK